MVSIQLFDKDIRRCYHEFPMGKDTHIQIIERIDSLHTRVDKIESTMLTRNEFNTTMDEVLTIARRLDQERVFTLEWVRRIEADVERVKKHLHLA